MEKLVIKPRPKRQKYQVRFWSDKKLYDDFTQVCNQEQIVRQDAFEQFMKWFIRKHKCL